MSAHAQINRTIVVTYGIHNMHSNLRAESALAALIQTLARKNVTLSEETNSVVFILRHISNVICTRYYTDNKRPALLQMSIREARYILIIAINYWNSDKINLQVTRNKLIHVQIYIIKR